MIDNTLGLADLPFDDCKGCLPLPYSERGRKAIEWVKQNAVPLLCAVVGLVI